MGFKPLRSAARRVVSRTSAQTGRAAHFPMGKENERHCREALCSANENKVGKLYTFARLHPPQHRTGEKTAGMSRIPDRARDGPPDRADSQRPIHLSHGLFSPQLACPERKTQSLAGEARRLALLIHYARATKATAIRSIPAPSRRAARTRRLKRCSSFVNQWPIAQTKTTLQIPRELYAIFIAVAFLKSPRAIPIPSAWIPRISPPNPSQLHARRSITKNDSRKNGMNPSE